MRNSSRRAVLASIAALGMGGCVGTSDDSSGTPDETPAPSDDTATPVTGTPTSTPSERSTPTPGQTPDDSTPTATPDDPTPSETPTQTPTDERLFPGYETTAVTFRTADGTTLGSVTAAIAETSDEWQTGLSETESMPEDRGMLFVDDAEKRRTFWMKDMDFGLDMIFIDEDKRITSITHAEAPGPDEDGTEVVYAGLAQYVLEVNYHWTKRHDVLVRDRVEFSL